MMYSKAKGEHSRAAGPFLSLLHPDTMCSSEITRLQGKGYEQRRKQHGWGVAMGRLARLILGGGKLRAKADPERPGGNGRMAAGWRAGNRARQALTTYSSQHKWLTGAESSMIGCHESARGIVPSVGCSVSVWVGCSDSHARILCRRE